MAAEGSVTETPKPPGKLLDLGGHLHLTGKGGPTVVVKDDAEDSQCKWSTEYFAKWHSTSQTGTLGAMPLIVLTRADGGYDNNLDVPAAQLEKERLEGQSRLLQLSIISKQIIVHSGHNMHLEARTRSFRRFMKGWTQSDIRGRNYDRADCLHRRASNPCQACFQPFGAVLSV